MAAWNERFADPYLPRTLARRLRDAGFEVRSRDALVLFNPDYDLDTYSLTNGRIMTDFVVGRQAITRDEVAAWTSDLEQLGRQDDYFFSPNRYLFRAEKRQPGADLVECVEAVCGQDLQQHPRCENVLYDFRAGDDTTVTRVPASLSTADACFTITAMEQLC